MRLSGYVFSFLVWMASLGAALAATGDRVALVIGNAKYDNVSALGNPVNDATDLAATLERVGFSVTLVTDADFTDMNRALRDFSNEALGADMALVYFAGHGIEIDKQNYLIPTDAELASDRQIALETISLDLVTEAVSGAKTLRMVLVDACRNNPFVNTMTRSVAGRNIGRGLSPMEPTGGTLVAFAAKGGTVAEDGNGRNSPFMSSLLGQIEQPGLDVSLMFRKVRDQVLEATDYRQEPFTYGSLPGKEIFIVPPVKVASLTPESRVDVAPAGIEPVQPRRKPKADDQEEFAWTLVKDTTDPAALKMFIKSYPGGAHADEAFDRLLILQSGDATPVHEEEPVVETKTADIAPVKEIVTPRIVETPVEPAIDLYALTKDIQEELKRAGCNPGTPDGIWGKRSRTALSSFERSSKVNIASTEPTMEVLEILRSVPGKVCVASVEPTVKKKKTEEVKTRTPKKKEPKRERVVTHDDEDEAPTRLKFRDNDHEETPRRGKACIGFSTGFGGGSISIGSC